MDRTREPCGCSMDPDPTVSTGFLPILVALVLLSLGVAAGVVHWP